MHHYRISADQLLPRTVSPSTARSGYKIEVFEPTEDFKPARSYKSRLKWNDPSGGEQSKLLAPEIVIAEILEAKVQAPAQAKRPVKRPGRGRSGSRRMLARLVSPKVFERTRCEIWGTSKMRS